MSTLPDEIKADLTARKTRDVTQEDIAKILRNGKRPYYTVSQIKAELSQDPSKPPIRSRLGDLIDANYVKEEQVGRMHFYWWNHSDSEWPVPPDVEVEPVPDEMTISEFFNRPYVKRSAKAIGVIVIGSLLMILGTIVHLVVGELPFQMLVWIVGFSFLASTGGFIILFSSVYRLLQSDAEIMVD